MRTLLKIAFTTLIAFLISFPALADKRVALVIGNSSYQKATQLRTPASDAAAVATMLKSAGFSSVETKLDARAGELRKALRDFTDRSRDADVAVVYYAGHAMQVDNINYLIPVDATLAKEEDVLDEALSLDRVLIAIESAKKLGIVLLDGCRENPFAKKLRLKGSGLARVEPSKPNILVALSAKDGSLAPDGAGPNSPYTKALLDHLAKPDQDIRMALGQIRDDVMRVTKSVQAPYVYGSVDGDKVVLAGVAPVANISVDQNATARRDFDVAGSIGTIATWDEFIARYPSGSFTDRARAKREELVAEARRVEAKRARLAAEQVKAAEQALAAEKTRAELAKRTEEANAAQAKLALAKLAEAKLAEAERAKAAKPAVSPPKGRRIALVIGNSKYKNAPLLPNPQRDAMLVADALKRTGFAEVTLLTDLGKEATVAALQAFSRAARTADWAVVYFAGHGIEIGGINYIVPVDATLETDRDVEFEAVPLNQVLNVVGGASKLRLVLLDACRINPFANRMKREVVSRAVSRGFVRQEPNPGTLVVYAARAGDVAADGVGSNSPFSTAFVQNVLKPGVEISRLFRLVGDDVRDATKGEQTPNTYGELTGREEFYFIDPK